jgi:putative membrane protein
MDSRAEVELGNVAQQNASSDAVKQFGQRMVQDHSKASKELERLVSKKGIALSKTVDEDQRTDAVKFSKLSGPNFDRAYMREMVDDHKKTLEEFQRQAESAQDPDVRSFAVNSLPNLQDHLRQAQEVMSSLRKK